MHMVAISCDWSSVQVWCKTTDVEEAEQDWFEVKKFNAPQKLLHKLGARKSHRSIIKIEIASWTSLLSSRHTHWLLDCFLHADPGYLKVGGAALRWVYSAVIYTMGRASHEHALSSKITHTPHRWYSWCQWPHLTYYNLPWHRKIIQHFPHFLSS